MLDDYPDYQPKTGPNTDAVDALVSELWRAVTDHVARSPITDAHMLALRTALASYRKCTGIE